MGRHFRYALERQPIYCCVAQAVSSIPRISPGCGGDTEAIWANDLFDQCRSVVPLFGSLRHPELTEQLRLSSPAL